VDALGVTDEDDPRVGCHDSRDGVGERVRLGCRGTIRYEVVDDVYYEDETRRVARKSKLMSVSS
jgi:hypothetical protein